ncbi:MAG: type II toxin-antitoxin system prevent-host-death family antitoxin [Bryobacteraceae bacterium]|nr:type II toxin-antitoxin system prevent-host-death family antitoxin [Bryobacteraceae bacterium]
MKRAAVSELKASLSRYLAMVKAGEEVLITERGRLIAHLCPLSPMRPGDEEEGERLRRLEIRGIVRIGKGKLPRKVLTTFGPPDPTGKLRKALIDERREGR